MSDRVSRAARIAATQHGVITARQLLDAGLSRPAIKRWAEKGLLHREFWGVYRLGHRAPNVEASYMAAVLACGPHAALSGRAAAHHLSLIRNPPATVEVTTPTSRRHPAITTRRRTVRTSRHRGIPTTTIAQTLQDLATNLPLDDLALACHQARVIHRVSKIAVPRGIPGAPNLRAIYQGDHHLTLSRLERLFLDALRSRQLPLPQTNRQTDRHYIDCRWPAHRLTVELDSFRHHGTRHAWGEDHRRDRAARARGDEYRRYTWADVAEDPAAMLEDLAPLLGFPAKLQ